jgi:hypothetical protein
LDRYAAAYFKGNMRRALVAFSNRTMSMAWKKWAACTAGTAALREGKLRKFMARLASLALGKAFNTWYDAYAQPIAVAEEHWGRRCGVEAVGQWAAAVRSKKRAVAAVGLYKFNPVDPCLESAWFQPLTL